MWSICSRNGTYRFLSERTTRFSKRAECAWTTHGRTQRASCAAHASCYASLSFGPRATEPRMLEMDTPIFAPQSRRISSSRNPISQTCAARKKSISPRSIVSPMFREDWVRGHEELSRCIRARRHGLHRVPPPAADAKHLDRNPRPGTDEGCRTPPSPAAQRARRRPRSHRDRTTGILPAHRETRLVSRKDARIRSIARNPLRLYASVLSRAAPSVDLLFWE